jgi:putative radical SAM enzyme (TIGR03279 family)
MSVRIKQITGTSGFFKEGDEIVAVDDAPVEDQLDLIFHMPDDGSAVFSVQRADGRRVRRRLTAATVDRAGLVLEEMKFQRCHSRCPFCFVDQMPRGLRPALYEKDDDYRLSFLYGNFITLNDMRDADIRRIMDMHLSPLYISIHALDVEVRARLFGRPMRSDILGVIERLAQHDIVMHMQVVLVPGVNDGEVLERTVDGLFGYYPSCRSLAVVPVGLTAHRDGLAELRGVSPEEASELVMWAKRKARRFRRDTGAVHFLHLSDEFYLLADEELPEEEEYDGFPQISNGVGMCRTFIADVKTHIDRIPHVTGTPLRMAVVTGTLGDRFLRRYVLPIIRRRTPWLHIELIIVENRLFGESVGVSGLIAGRDIIEATRHITDRTDCIVIPPNAVSHEGLFIDDLRPRDIEAAVGTKVFVPKETFLERRTVKACLRMRK